MSLIAAFQPLGNTVLLVGNSVAPTGIQAPVTVGLGASQYHIVNTGTSTVFLSYANAAVLAQSQAVIPTGTGANATTTIPVMPGVACIYSLPTGSYFSAISAVAVAQNIYITPGEGV